MPQRTPLSREDQADEYYREKFNRGGHTSANDLKSLENQLANSADTDDIQNIEDYANDPKNSNKNIDKTREDESSANARAWRQNYTGKGDNKITGKGMSKKKKWGLFGGVSVGISGLLVAAFLAILPMKIEAFVQNISKKVDAVPEYAVKQRANYLITHAIAVRMMQLDNPGHNTVFCKSGTIGCSLLRTYTTNFIEKKYDLKFTKSGDTIKITPNGRTKLGGNATSWEVEYKRGEGLSTITKKIEKNSEMKKYLGDMLKEKEIGGVVKRYLVRKILMRKYGVTAWRGFEEKRASFAEKKTTIKAKIIKNTFGRVSSRMGVYFGCLSGGDTATCEKTINEIHGDSVDGDKARSKYLGDEPKGDETEKALQKFFSKQILTKAASVVGLVMLGDMVLHGLSSADNGSLDIVAQDMVANIDTGYAFGDETGIVTNAEKVMAGDGNMETLGILSQTLDGATTSPLMQVDNGITAPQFAAITGGGSSGMSCNSSFSDTPQPIPKGQLVCDNEKFVRGYSKMLHSIPALGSLLSYADFYTKSPAGEAIHKLVDIINSLTSAAFNLAIKFTPGAQQAIHAITSLFSGPLKAMISFIFDPPTVGVGASGGHNYVALRGALTNASNQSMEQGVDDQGNAMGGGGSVLSSQQVAAIQKTEMNDTAGSNSAIASLFSPYVEGSLTQQFILTAPTQPSTMIASLLSLPSSLFSSLTPSANAADPAAIVNPMGVIPYGYAKDSKVFTADPDIYTESYCTKSAQIREQSLTLPSDDGYQYAVPYYQKNDPCALEKMTVGSLLTADGVTDNEYSLKDPVPDSGSDTTPVTSTPTTGSAQDLAKEMLQNKNISYIFDAKKDVVLASEGKPGTCNAPIDPQLFAVANDIGQNHKLIISAIESGCTGHMTGSDHYKGKAIDFADIDGTVAYLKIASVWPEIQKDATGAYFLQRQCVSPAKIPTPSGMTWKNADSCTHIHMSLSG